MAYVKGKTAQRKRNQDQEKRKDGSQEMTKEEKSIRGGVHYKWDKLNGQKLPKKKKGYPSWTFKKEKGQRPGGR